MSVIRHLWKIVALAALAGVAAGCGDPASNPCAGNVAVVNGHPISTAEYKRELRYTLNFYEWAEPKSEYYANNICGLPVFAKACRSIKTSLYNRMIDQQIVNDYAHAHRIVLTRADRAVATAAENKLKHQIGGELAFQTFLHLKLQTSYAEFRKIELQQVMTAKVMNSVVPLAMSGPQAFVRQIFIPFGGPGLASQSVHDRYVRKAHAKALSIMAQLRSGASFATLARRYSGDPASRANGGVLGWVNTFVGDPAFTHAVFTLPMHTLKLIKSTYGYNIVEVDDKQVLGYQGAALAAARQHRFVIWLNARKHGATITRCTSVA